MYSVYMWKMKNKSIYLYGVGLPVRARGNNCL